MSMDNDGGALDAWTRHLKARALRPASIKAYRGWVTRLCAFHGDADPLTLTPDDLEAWVGAHDWRPNSHQKAVQAVQYFYRWARSKGLIDADPSVELVPAQAPRPIPNPCPEEDYRRALDNASGDAYWRLRLAGETGLRRAELAAVHSEDVSDLVTGPALRVVGKGGKQRWVPLPADLAVWIRLQHGHVFPTASGHMTPAGVGAWYRRVLGTNPHRLRHRYATLAYHAGHDINAVRDLLGHSNVSTTQQYVAVAGEDLIAAASGAWREPAVLKIVA